MPKQKTHSSSKKRFKVTGSGKVLHKQAFRMRHLRHSEVASDANARIIKKMIPYA